MAPELDTVGNRLIDAFREKGFSTTQIDIGKRCGVAQPVISAYVAGTKYPSMDRAISIASIGGVCVEWLLTGRGPRYANEANGVDELPEEMKKNPEFVKEFGRRFTALVDERYGDEWVQDQVAKDLGVKQPTVWAWLNGEHMPGFTTAVAVALDFGVCVEWLLTGRGAKHPQTEGAGDELTEPLQLLLNAYLSASEHEQEVMDAYAKQIIGNISPETPAQTKG